MTARNPTDWNRWLDHKALVAGSEIKFTVPNKVRDDQVYTLDAEMLLISDCIEGYGITSAAFVQWHEFGSIYSKDMCGVDGVTNNEISHEWCVYFFAAVGTNGEAQMGSTAIASSSSTIVLTGDGTWKWAGFGTLNIKTNNTLDTITVSGKRTAGVGTILFGGVGCFALVT